MDQPFSIDNLNNEKFYYNAQPNDIAPLFIAEAYNNLKKKIETIELEEYRGKWIILFFYPSDFTFV